MFDRHDELIVHINRSRLAARAEEEAGKMNSGSDSFPRLVGLVLALGGSLWDAQSILNRTCRQCGVSGEMTLNLVRAEDLLPTVMTQCSEEPVMAPCNPVDYIAVYLHLLLHGYIAVGVRRTR